MSLDITFCASPNCKNECGRKMTQKQFELIQEACNINISYSFFCGHPSYIKDDVKIELNHPRQYILSDGNKSN